ncbi:MAG: response regulator [Candidatus Hydrogenedentota bacterium]
MSHHEPPTDEQPSAPNSHRPSLLLLEDDDDMRAMLAEVLREEGWDITECENVFPLIQACIEQKMDDRKCSQPPYDVIVSDNRMPGMSAIKTMQMLHTIRFGAQIPPTILITAFGDAETHRLALELGAAAVLDKPFDTKELISKVREFAPRHGP